MAAGRTVSVEDYRALPDTLDVAVERTSATDGWRVGDASCADRLAFLEDLRVENRSYAVEGRYEAARLDRAPSFRRLRLAGVLPGAGLLVVGAREVLGREAS